MVKTKTHKYYFDIVLDFFFNKTVQRAFDSMDILGVYLGDKDTISIQDNTFLIRVKVNRNYFLALPDLKTTSYYKGTWAIPNDEAIIVFKTLPINNFYKYAVLESAYSKIYGESMLENIKISQRIPKSTYDVLSKNPKLLDKIAKEYQLSEAEKSCIKELDSAFKLEEEIWNNRF